jgi:hypothetical protein
MAIRETETKSRRPLVTSDEGRIGDLRLVIGDWKREITNDE